MIPTIAAFWENELIYKQGGHRRVLSLFALISQLSVLLGGLRVPHRALLVWDDVSLRQHLLIILQLFVDRWGVPFHIHM